MYSVWVAFFFVLVLVCRFHRTKVTTEVIRFLPDLPLLWDYHNLMLIEVVTAMNTDVKEKCGTAIFRSASASGALQVIKGSFLFLLFVCPNKRSRAAYNPKNTVVMSCFKALNLLGTVKSDFILLFFTHSQTYIGHILLLVNPNKELPIYSTLVSICLNIFTWAFSAAPHSFRIYRPTHCNPCIKHVVLH